MKNTKTNSPAASFEKDGRDGLPARPFARLVSILSAVLIFVAATAFTGCAVENSYGVGYSAAYYAPDYSPYYGDYAYSGDPYWGPGPYYNTEIIIHGGHHRLYYGGHNFAHDSGGGFSRSGGGRFGGGGRRGR